MSGQVDFPLMAMRPHENWEIGPLGSAYVIEVDFSFESEAQLVVSFCLLDFEALVPCYSSTTFVAISLRNGAPHVLKVVKISEVAAIKVFMMKYIQGLLLFPRTVTQVAMVTCTQLFDKLHETPPNLSYVNNNYKLVVLTNDSSSPEVGIPCQNIIHICLRHQKGSSVGLDPQSENAESGIRTGSLDSSTQLRSEITVCSFLPFFSNLWPSWYLYHMIRCILLLEIF